jgi:sterol desaturase/sphingolipid hydroxylase (fatty acid hydroxylase superfamily)
MASIFKTLQTAFTALLTLTGLGIVITAVYYGFGSAREPGPGFFPCFAGLLIIAFGLILLFADRRGNKGQKLFDTKEGMFRFWLTVTSFVLWLLLLNSLGFLITTFLVTVGNAKIFQMEGWVKPALLALGTTFFIFLIFDIWFYTDLPRGLLG